MSEPEYQDEPLQRLIDGDLSPSEEASLRAKLSRDADSAAELARLERLGTLMQAASRELQSRADSEALFARIQAGIEADAEAETTATRAGAPAPEDTSLWARIFGHRAWVPATGVAVLAAAVLMTIYRPVTPDELETATPLGGGASPANDGERAAPGVAPEGHAAEATPDPEAAQAAEAAALPRAAPSSEVVQVDFGNNAGTVFDVALSDGASTPVIWINDEE